MRRLGESSVEEYTLQLIASSHWSSRFWSSRGNFTRQSGISATSKRRSQPKPKFEKGKQQVWVLLLRALQPAPERLVQAAANIVGKREKLTVTIKLYRFAGRIEYRVAMVAPGQVRFQDLFQFLVQIPVQVARNLIDGFLAV